MGFVRGEGVQACNLILFSISKNVNLQESVYNAWTKDCDFYADCYSETYTTQITRAFEDFKDFIDKQELSNQLKDLETTFPAYLRQCLNAGKPVDQNVAKIKKVILNFDHKLKKYFDNNPKSWHFYMLTNERKISQNQKFRL